jgi:hypothetical protein
MPYILNDLQNKAITCFITRVLVEKVDTNVKYVLPLS